MDFEVKEMEMIERAIDSLKKGQMIVVTDDESRENEGDLVALAETITKEQITFMAVYGRGLICAPISSEIARKLELSPMVHHNTDNHGTAFTVAIDHLSTTTGISASDRAETIRQLVSIESKSTDFRRPGHIFPLIAKDGGVLERDGHTEASIDLAKLANKAEVAVICEIMWDDGEMLAGERLVEFTKKHQLPLISIEVLKHYLMKQLQYK